MLLGSITAAQTFWVVAAPWVAVIGTLGGVLAGKFWEGRSDKAHWLRQERLRATTEFLAASHLVWSSFSYLALATEDHPAWANFTNSALGASEAINRAEEVLLILGPNELADTGEKLRVAFESLSGVLESHSKRSVTLDDLPEASVLRSLEDRFLAQARNVFQR